MGLATPETYPEKRRLLAMVDNKVRCNGGIVEMKVVLCHDHTKDTREE